MSHRGGRRLGVVTAVQLLEVIGSLLGWVLAYLGLAAAALPLRRGERTRLPALGWQAGLVAMVALAGVLALVGVPT